MSDSTNISPTNCWIEIKQCPVCSSSKNKKLFTLEDYSIYQCTSCHLRFANPCLSPESMKALYESTETLLESNAFHENYYDYGNLETPSKTLHEFNYGLNLIEKALPPNSRTILDVGFGNGLFLAAAQKRNWKVQGIDSSASNVALALSKFNLNLTQSTLENFHSNECFDAVTMWDVLEHFANPQQVVKKIHSLLKPNGVALIAVPRDENIISAVGAILYHLSFGIIKKGLSSWYVREHICFYTLDPLKSLFKNWHFLDSFCSSTDLAKYKFHPISHSLASTLLNIGTLLQKQNRLIAVFRKK